MNSRVIALIVQLLTKAPQEVADIEAMIAAIGADKDVLAKAKDALNGALKCLNDLGV